VTDKQEGREKKEMGRGGGGWVLVVEVVSGKARVPPGKKTQPRRHDAHMDTVTTDEVQ